MEISSNANFHELKAESPRIREERNLCSLGRSLCKFASRGFTFVELMLVIVLIGVMIVLAAPRMRSTFSGLEVAGFAKKTAALMRYAQSKAIAEREMIYLIYKERGQTEKEMVFYLAKYDSPPPPQEKKLSPVDERYNLVVPSAITININKENPPGPPDNLPKDAVSAFSPDSTIQGAKIIISNEVQKFKIVTTQGGIGRISIEEIQK